MFFTITVLVILSLFLVSYTVYSLIEEQKVIQKRVSAMNSFLFSIEQDLERQVYISGFRSILVAEQWITENGQYLADLNTSLQENFFDGKMYGQDNSLLLGTTYGDIEDAINLKANQLNINVTLAHPTISITQDDPWNVKITFTVNLEMQDQADLATWNRTETIVSKIPVSNFEDPLYVISTAGKVTNTFNKTVTSTFVSGSDVTALLDHATNSRYIASTSAPSFINRIQGQVTTSNPQGIESIVNLQELAAQGITLQDKSSVDYIYFSNSNPTSYHVLGMPSWFKVDNSHILVYQVTGLTY